MPSGCAHAGHPALGSGTSRVCLHCGQSVVRDGAKWVTAATAGLTIDGRVLTMGPVIPVPLPFDVPDEPAPPIAYRVTSVTPERIEMKIVDAGEGDE